MGTDPRTLHGYHNAERKYPIIRLKDADTPVAIGDRADAVAAVAMSFLTGDGQAIPEQNLAAIGIFDLDQEFIQSGAAVKPHPAAALI